jgi:hypothetical protein
VETQEQRKEEAGSRVSAFIAREGTHITLTAEAYKLHVQISAGGVKDRADANKVAIVHQTASTKLWRDGKAWRERWEHTLAPTTQWCQSELGDCSSFNGA